MKRKRSKFSNEEIDDKVLQEADDDYLVAPQPPVPANHKELAEADAEGDEEDEAVDLDEKRLRLAQGYLKRISKADNLIAHSPLDDDAFLTHGEISSKLDDEQRSLERRLLRPLALVIKTKLAAISDSSDTNTSLSSASTGSDEVISVSFSPGHSLSTTCVAISSEGHTAFTGSKDCTIIRWDLSDTRNRPMLSCIFPGRRRTKEDVARQKKLALDLSLGKKLPEGVVATLPVFGGTHGGGVLGTVSSESVGVSSLNSISSQDGVQARRSSSSNLDIARAKVLITSSNDSMIVAQPAGPPSAKALAAAHLRGMPHYGIDGHWDEVLSLSLTSDGKVLASGGRDRSVRLWLANSGGKIPSSAVDGGLSFTRPTSLDTFVGHKDSVYSLSFRPGQDRTLVSASADRTLKLWKCLDGTPGSHIETLFGHQADVLDVEYDILGKDRIVSIGRDRTARLWKVPEQTQLLFRAQSMELSTECVRSINCGDVKGETFFITGAQDGSLSLWCSTKKRPVYITRFAHGTGEMSSRSNQVDIISLATGADVETLLSGGYCNWITSMAVLPNSDLIATGSGDGFIRLWRICFSKGRDSTPNMIESVGSIPMKGFVTGLAFGGSEKNPLLVASIGQEHRLGRWWRYKQAKNGIAVIRFSV